MPSTVTSMMQWKKVLAKEVAEESSSSHQWQNTGAHSQRDFIKLARGCLWFLAAEECHPLLHQKNCPQNAQVILVLKKRKRDPMYGTGFQRWAHLVSLQMACCLLQHWAEEKTGCHVAPHFVYPFYLCLSWLHGSSCFESPLAPPATEMHCQKDVLLAHSPMLEWHNANYSSKFKLFRDGNPTPTAMKGNGVPGCGGKWAGFLPCLADFLPWGQRRSYLVARVHQYELISC